MNLTPSAAVLVAATLMASTTLGADKAATLKITQKYLVVICRNTHPVTSGERQWSLGPGEEALVFTMRSAPREGTISAAPAAGMAAVTFTPEAGHRYEVEVRAPATTFSSRVWQRGEWTPVVRDRTSDRVVSGDPQWIDRGCQP